MYIHSQLKRFACFAFQILVISILWYLCAVLQVLWTAANHLPPFCCRSLHTSRIYWVWSMLWVRQDRNQSPSQGTQKAWIFNICIKSFFLISWRIQELVVYFSLVSYWTGGRDYSKWVHAGLNHHLCGLQPRALSYQHEMQARQKAIPEAAPQNVSMYVKIFSFLPQKVVKS